VPEGTTPKILKKPGHYSLADWQHLVDSLWGPGLPTATKLSVFDTFWNAIDRWWGGFPNTSINWDSLRNVYRPIVAGGVSRGRFAGILSRLTRELLEWHAGALDTGIDSTMGYDSDIYSSRAYPGYVAFHYEPSIPILNINLLFWRTVFGAGLTLVHDSTLVVYNVMPNHPLGLQPGDIILGYDDKRWQQLLQELFDAELPIFSNDLAGNWLGSTTAASFHQAMISAGMNWGLFDTIDVVKYPSNDTVHFPTSLLSTITPPYHVATEQMPVNGVPFPDLQGNQLVSWGVVQGTNIGYIYGWDWGGVPWGDTKVRFGQAVSDLIHNKNVRGLILDFRTNPGGWPEFANDGLAQLFNFDPTPNYSSAIRIPGSNHSAFTVGPGRAEERFTPGGELFDHPIAVLTGPLCGSSGDYNAFRMRFHPMSRSFGRATAGAYTDFNNDQQGGRITGPYYYRVDNGSVYSNFNNEGLLIHKPFPVDEEVWLTRSGVARGEDDVVMRALEWINTVTHVHDVALDPYYARPGVDSVTVTAVLANPLHHQSAVSAVVTDYGLVRDSMLFYNDGLHGDGTAGDSIWGARLLAPANEGTFSVSVETKDLTQGTSRLLPNVLLLTTAGPLALDTIQFQDNRGDANCEVLPFVKNMGSAAPFKSATVHLVCTDPWVTGITPAELSLYDIAAGETRNPNVSFWITYNPSIIPDTFNLKFELGMSGHVCWTVPVILNVGPVVEVAQKGTMPTAYALTQNYPNPFNPSTTIKFELPKTSHVTLTVYDILGRQVSALVNERRDAGVHEVKFEAAGLASGVYFYRIQAGEFVATKKLLLMK
jgi:hypothetical protein